MNKQLFTRAFENFGPLADTLPDAKQIHERMFQQKYVLENVNYTPKVKDGATDESAVYAFYPASQPLPVVQGVPVNS